MIDLTSVTQLSRRSGSSRALEDFREERLFLWNPGSRSSQDSWETRRRRPRRVVLKWSESPLLFFHFNNAACARNPVVLMLFLIACLFSFPPALLLDERCQTRAQTPSQFNSCWRRPRRRHARTYVCVFAHEPPPYGEYHTRTRTDMWTHEGTVGVKTRPFGIRSFLAVAAHTWRVMRSAYGRRGWRELSSRWPRCSRAVCQCKS